MGPDRQLWSSCPYLGDEKRRYPYCLELKEWEKLQQIGIEPVSYKGGRFSIHKSTWTEQTVEVK